ncbi:MAG: lytic transglycosylase domain-containing protein [Deltaproteobacteria bacterium]|nr:lytic transglycosylase domain-containing protein [Deltaproteobacteria bacterium]
MRPTNSALHLALALGIATAAGVLDAGDARAGDAQADDARADGARADGARADDEMFGCDRAFHAPSMLATTEGEIWIQRACIDDRFRHGTQSGFDTLGGVAMPATAVDHWVRRATANTGVPGSILHGLITFLSGYHPYAVASDGRRGLLMLSPTEMASEGFDVQDLMDPQRNVEHGAQYLRRLITTYRDLPIALGAFIAGRTAVMRSDGIPDDRRTRWIVREVMRKFEAEEAPFPADEGAETMARVWSWLD